MSVVHKVNMNMKWLLPMREAAMIFTTTMEYWSNVAQMVAHCLRRRPNIDPTLDTSLVYSLSHGWVVRPRARISQAGDIDTTNRSRTLYP